MFAASRIVVNLSSVIDSPQTMHTNRWIGFWAYIACCALVGGEVSGGDLRALSIKSCMEVCDDISKSVGSNITVSAIRRFIDFLVFSGRSGAISGQFKM